MTRKHKRQRSASDALDLVPDNIGDGARMAMAAEMSGQDYESFCMDLAAEAEDKQKRRRTRGRTGT